MLHLLEGPELRMHYFVLRHTHYHCATKTAREVNLRDMVFGSVLSHVAMNPFILFQTLHWPKHSFFVNKGSNLSK